MGCMRLPGRLAKPDLAEADRLIMEAIGAGINFFDTAYIYPGSENALGYVLDKNKVREKVYIGTKLPLFRCHSYTDFEKHLAKQLERLKTDYVDYYFMHSVSKPQDWQRLVDMGILKWLAEKRGNGQIRQVGFSYHGNAEDFPILIDAHDWDFCMIQYNYVNVNYQAGEAGLKYAHSKGVPVFVMEPLLGGQLSHGLPSEAKELFEKATPGTSPASWALRWLWSQPEVTMVLSGMNKSEQIHENATLSETSQMTDAELKTVAHVANIFAKEYKIPCTGCNYCLPLCPKKINIPDSFMAYNASYSIGRMTGFHQYATTTGGLSKTFSVHDCTGCAACEKICPQGIEIVRQIGLVKKRMEPWWYRAAMSLARKVMAGRR